MLLKMADVDRFSESYSEARTNFLAAAEAANARVYSYDNPNMGPDGEGLHTDVATLGPDDAEGVLLLGSGTHGVEGFCGSGIQTGLLQDGIEKRLPPNLRLVMVHAINPYGFSYLRRVNEDNIDLNRNFVDHSEPYRKNTNYDALAKVINPRPYWPLSSGASITYLLLYQVIHGRAALQSAITSGQHEHPQGLFYGGQFETWSNKTFRAIAQRELKDAVRVAFVDIHTGLGPHGYGEIITNDQPGSAAFERAVKWWGDKVRTTKDGSAVSADLTGPIKTALYEMFPELEITAVSLEFGTEPAMKVLRAMQAENWQHYHGGQNLRRAIKIKSEMLRVFYPDSSHWKARAWKQGEEVVTQAISGLSNVAAA